MNCVNCHSQMTTRSESAPYKALPGTVLVGVGVSRCPKCGEYEIHISNITALNRVLMGLVIRKTGRLTGDEIRFLRSSLDLSAAGLARAIGSAAATVCRWESGKQPIAHHADLLLRAMVALAHRLGMPPFATVTTREAERMQYVLEPIPCGWRPAASCAPLRRNNTNRRS